MLIVSATLADTAFGQTIPVTPEPVGSGARALAQSAFIAVADDATAASWNPAGLINLERPEASFVGAWRTTTKDYSQVGAGPAMGEDSWSEAAINFMSYANPIEVGNTDAVMSVNYHQVYDLGIEFNGLLPLTDSLSQKISGQSEGAVCAYSLAGGLSMSSQPVITIGASFNWFSKSLLYDYAWQVSTIVQALDEKGEAIPDFGASATETFDGFRGYNFTFGLLWDAYERKENLLTLGFVCHTPFTARVVRDEVVHYEGESEPEVHPPQRLDIDFPPSIGVGANYRFSDSLSAAFDVQWTDWSGFKQRNRSTGERDSPIESDIVAFRLGCERLWFSDPSRDWVYAWRGGIFYEPRPVPGEPLPLYGLSLGLGWTLKERFSLDLAYQFRWGEGKESPTADFTDIDYRIHEHFLVTSLITYF